MKTMWNVCRIVLRRLGPGRLAWAVTGLTLVAVSACLWLPGRGRPVPPPGVPGRTVTVETTGYCECRLCCGWERTWYGKPVFSSGPNKGKPKVVGQTAGGVQARRGTLAADPAVFPMGTIVKIPGYGYGRVEDRGGAIRGRHLDLFFRSHREALEWGRKTLSVKVWYPE